MRIAALAPASEVGSAYAVVPGSDARRPEAAHPRVHVGQDAQRADQLGDVHAGTAVDLGWVLLAEDVDAHEPNLGATQMGWKVDPATADG